MKLVVQRGAPMQFDGESDVDAALSLIERRPPPADPRVSSTPGTPPMEVVDSGRLGQLLKSKPNGWFLVARHRDGSLESVVGSMRRRWIAAALTMLTFLGGFVTLLVWTSRQSKHLARRQMQFIAGVSHELLTPLSVIRTAAANISRGLVNDREKALEYGKVLDKESRRLSKMIEQVLGFAAIQSGVRRRDLEPVDVEHLTHEILSEYRHSLERQGWEICENIEPVGKARIDRRGLETCLCNLLDNAAKYADRGRWLRVTASRESDSPKAVVRITVEDHGPGIAPEDLRHVFKAFYRGRGLAASNVPGAGLGLSIVRQQLRNLGGDISVLSTAQGCVFSVVIPAAD
jgi:signal transduction histidine kinase